MNSEGEVKVLVTGASGFVGSHICASLLEQSDSYIVKGTTRSVDDPEKVDELLHVIGGKHRDRFSLVPVELGHKKQKAQLLDAMKGCTFVIHTAGPMELATTTKRSPEAQRLAAEEHVKDMDLFLECCEVSQIQRLIYTSSHSTLQIARPVEEQIDNPLTSDDWNVNDPKYLAKYSIAPCYAAAKVAAEQRCLAYGKDPATNFDVVSIVPSVILGPTIVQRLNVSHSGFNDLIGPKGFPFSPSMWENFCDVRDVARAHVLAMITEFASNQRILMVGNGGAHNFLEVYRIAGDSLIPVVKDAKLRERLSRQPKPMPTAMVYVVGQCLPILNSIRLSHSKKAVFMDSIDFEHSKARTILGFEKLIDFEQSVRDTALSVAKINNVELDLSIN